MKKSILSMRLSPREALGALAGEPMTGMGRGVFQFRDLPYPNIPQGIVFSLSENVLHGFGYADELHDHWNDESPTSDAAALFVGRSVALRQEIDPAWIRFSSPAEVFALYRFLHSDKGMDRMQIYYQAMDELHKEEGGYRAVAKRFKGVGEGLAGLYLYYEHAAAAGDCMCFVTKSKPGNKSG